MAEADENAAARWRAWAWRQLVDLARTGEGFNGDDLEHLRQDAGEPAPANPNAVGSLFGKAAGRGIIERTGQRRRMQRANAHGRLTDVWRGTEAFREGLIDPD